MDKKITIPAGIALMVVLAVAGMLAIFSYSPAPAYAALSSGSIALDDGGRTLIKVTTDTAIADDTVISVELNSMFGIDDGFATDDVAVTSLASAEDSTEQVVPHDTFSHTAGETEFSIAVNQSSGIVVAAGETTEIIISIATGNITYPTGGALAGLYTYGNAIDIGGVTTGFDYEVTVAADSLDTLKDFFDTIPDKPNESDEVVLEFTAPDDPSTAPGTDTEVTIAAGDFITIVLHEDFQVPDDISEADVTIDGNVIATPIGTGATPIAVADAHPANVVVDDDSVFDPSDNDTADWLIQIEVGDMAVGDAFPGEQGIFENANVTVTIAKAAGIKAPLEAGDYYVAYSFEEEPGTLDFVETSEVTLNRLVTLSSQDGGRGDEVVATAKGISGQTADFWRDADGDGTRDLSEIYLCTASAITDNLSECTFTVTGDFDGGHGGNCDGTGDEPSSPSDCNIINVLDGENNTAKIDFDD